MPTSDVTTSAIIPQPSSAQTRPDYSRTGASLSDNLVIPRRGWDMATASLIARVKENPIAGLAFWAETAPARLLAVLDEHHPYFKRARANDLSLAFAPGDTRIVAVDVVRSVDADGQPVSREVVSTEMTAALDAFWDGLPPETGGLRGLQAALYSQISHAGACVLEAVPGPRGTGLSAALTADPLTFRLVDAPEGRLLQQNQSTGWKTMDSSLVRFSPWDGSRDNPYGVPRKSAALAEGLRDWKHQGNLDDILYEVAWPRLKWGFPLAETVKFASDNKAVLKGQGKPDPATGTPRDATPEEWAFAQFAKMATMMTDRRLGDSLGYMMGGLIEPLSGADGLAALEGTFQGLLLRLCTALLQPLTLMNLHVGGTLAYSDTEWAVHAKQLEDLRAFVNGVLAWLATMHLRLLGSSCTARVDCQSIQTSDAVKDEMARKGKIANELTLFDNGLISDEDLAMNLTGSGVVDKAKLSARAAAPAGSTAVGDPADPSPEPADPGAPAVKP